MSAACHATGARQSRKIVVNVTLRMLAGLKYVLETAAVVSAAARCLREEARAAWSSSRVACVTASEIWCRSSRLEAVTATPARVFGCLLPSATMPRQGRGGMHSILCRVRGLASVRRARPEHETLYQIQKGFHGLQPKRHAYSCSREQ